jgi:hypothetical protein
MAIVPRGKIRKGDPTTKNGGDEFFLISLQHHHFWWCLPEGVFSSTSGLPLDTF